MIQGLTVHKHGLLRVIAGIPTEDAFASWEEGNLRAMSVADGITRDCMNGKPLTRDWMGLVNARLFYPRNPNPAQAAANIFVESSLEALKSTIPIDETAVKLGFNYANLRIREWQRKYIRKVDYLANDFPGCVAALGIVDNRRGAFCWGQICDAGVALLDEKGNLVMMTENDGPEKHDAYIWNTDLMKGLNWKDYRARVNVRKVFRNNPHDEFHSGHTFGVLTGEEEALEYVRTGVQDFRPGYVAMAYTDGLEHVLFDRRDIRGNVVDAVRARNWGGFRKACKQGVETEGTVVYATGD